MRTKYKIDCVLFQRKGNVLLTSMQNFPSDETSNPCAEDRN